MTLRVACCRYFEAEVRAALMAEGLDGAVVLPFQGACDDRPKAACAPVASEPGTLLVAGDCAAIPGRSAGVDSCFSLLLGKEATDQCLARGVHLMTPAMLEAWQENAEAWGFTPNDARQFFVESITGFRVIDCSVASIRPELMAGLSDYSGLPVEVESCTLDRLRDWLRVALLQRGSGDATPKQGPAGGPSDYAMSLDLLQSLLHRKNEPEIVQGILETFAMLFAPDQVAIRLVNADGTLGPWTRLHENVPPDPRLMEFPGASEHLDGAGFHLSLDHEGSLIGQVLVTGLQFPEWKDHYLNLAHLLAPVLALVLVHQRQQGELVQVRLDAERAKHRAERLEAEKALAASEFKNQTMLRTSLDGLGLLDSQLRFIEANDAICRMLGYRRDELLTILFPALETGGATPDLEARMQEVRLEGSGLFELGLQTCEGGLLFVEASVTYLPDLEEYVIFLRDVSARKRSEALQRELEEGLRRTQHLESLGSLAGGIAHDLNNVLAAIQAVTQTLMRRSQPGEWQASGLGIVDQAVNRGRDLLRNLANLSRRDLRTPERVDLNEVAREVAELLNRTTFHRVEIVEDLQDPLPEVTAERAALSRAILDVCVNAIEAMPTGGRLVIRTRSLPENLVEVAIKDTGPGMTPEVLTHAMDPFFTTKPVGKGAGLGLAMAYATARAHKGAFLLQSEPGRGTTACFQIPAEHLPAPSVDPGSLREVGKPRAWRILMVDDDPLIRATIPEMLSLIGQQVTSVPGGHEALEQLAGGGQFDLILLDLNMPRMNGMETLSRIRVMHPRLPVLLATGHLDPATADLLAQDGHALSITKPYNLKEMEAKLAELRRLMPE